MAIKVTDIIQFVPKLEASRSNLVDEIMYESLEQTGRDVKDKDPTRLNELFSELANIHNAIAAFQNEAKARK